MRLNSKQIVLYTGGKFLVEPIDASEIMTGVTWDSRTVKQGDLYVALPGERVDGHQFVEEAMKAGARGVLVTESPASAACIYARELGIPIIEVPNTFHAIEDLARAWRDFIGGKVVAVTGSTGKTTTKNLVRDVCASRFATVATVANQNNELGVPNTILAADPDTQVVIVEMGMRGLGQIRHLCSIARPDWGVVTNVGDCHMELLGSRENIVRAKGELFDELPPGSGKAFANFDDESSEGMVDGARLAEKGIEVVRYGFGAGEAEGARVWPEDVTLDAEGRAVFQLCERGFAKDAPREATLFDMEADARKAACHLSIRGEHNVANACAAAGVGIALGIPVEDVARALSESISETGRLETMVARDGFTVVNDAYNANPDSMRAALKMLSSMGVSGSRIAVLGDMGELGDVEVSCHEGIGEFAAALYDDKLLDELICVGELARHVHDAAQEGGMPPEALAHVTGIAGALELLEGRLAAGDVVLVKASHFMNLDRLVKGLVS